jgi:tRNA pseudouridine55 synthase
MDINNLIEGELILIDKPYRWTSFDVVNHLRNIIRRKLGIKKIKIGHAGTLDPLATGLLIVCTGKFTKKIEELQFLEKQYTGSFTIGKTTPSYDLEKEIDNEYDYSHVTDEMIYNAANSFIGETYQIPPVFSAVKINGKRAYKYAREEEDIKLKPKKIFISEFEITEIKLPEVYFKINCSKGTYIRAIARDFGNQLKCGAYLSSLCRTRIGNYKLDDAFKIETIQEVFNSTSNQDLI